jgi:hypothetical protein
MSKFSLVTIIKIIQTAEALLTRHLLGVKFTLNPLHTELLFNPHHPRGVVLLASSHSRGNKDSGIVTCSRSHSLDNVRVKTRTQVSHVSALSTPLSLSIFYTSSPKSLPKGRREWGQNRALGLPGRIDPFGQWCPSTFRGSPVAEISGDH